MELLDVPVQHVYDCRPSLQEVSSVKAIISAIKDRIQGKVPLLSKRSSQWPTHRKHWLELNSECTACGSKEGLQVHHVKPFHLARELELDYNNYITLCEATGGRECHLHVGHKGSFRNENPAVRKDAAALRKSLGLPKLKSTIPPG